MIRYDTSDNDLSATDVYWSWNIVLEVDLRFLEIFKKYQSCFSNQQISKYSNISDAVRFKLRHKSFEKASSKSR